MNSGIEINGDSEEKIDAPVFGEIVDDSQRRSDKWDTSGNQIQEKGRPRIKNKRIAITSSLGTEIDLAG